MSNIEYSKSISEVLDILQHTKKEDVDRISPQFIEFLNNNKCHNYIPNLDHTKRIKEMGLSETTIGLLLVISSKFWCTQEQRRVFENRLIENEKKYQKELREKYNPDNLLKNKETRAETVESSVSIEKYKESIFTKIRNWFKRNF